MTERRRAALLFLGLAIVAAVFRFPHLADRPMHADEAVNADRLGTLLEQGRYEYSSMEFHGPTLLYLGAAVARLQGITHYTDLSETLLRAVPAVLGVLLVAAHFFLVPYLGLTAAFFAGLFTAVSPAMVYYSRDFIHEMLLLFLTFSAMVALFAYFRRRSAALALVTGTLFGLIYATKETTVVIVASMLVGAAFSGTAKTLKPFPSWKDMSITLGSAIVVGALFMSSFLTHPRGIIDSILAYGTYFQRGAGIHTVHLQPWSYYLGHLLYFHLPGGPFWSEALIVVLSLIGFIVAVRRAGIPRFLAIYTVLMVLAYSAIPYKAPWNLLGFLQGMTLLAGIGAAWLMQHRAKVVIAALLLLGTAHLGWQAQAASFRYSSDPRNPWVYAQTGTDVFEITGKIAALAAAAPAGKAMPVQIVTRENLWPLPWYLRRYSGVRWWNGVSDTAPNAPVILATPDMEPALLHKIYELPPPGQREMYLNMFDRDVELRPRVEVRGYVAKSLWDVLQEKQ